SLIPRIANKDQVRLFIEAVFFTSLQVDRAFVATNKSVCRRVQRHLHIAPVHAEKLQAPFIACLRFHFRHDDVAPVSERGAVPVAQVQFDDVLFFVEVAVQPRGEKNWLPATNNHRVVFAHILACVVLVAVFAPLPVAVGAFLV
ncbi:unnamed protein product, partial [Oikopleura dioica]